MTDDFPPPPPEPPPPTAPAPQHKSKLHELHSRLADLVHQIGVAIGEAKFGQ